jgi:hypothetical protein
LILIKDQKVLVFPSGFYCAADYRFHKKFNCPFFGLRSHRRGIVRVNLNHTLLKKNQLTITLV